MNVIYNVWDRVHHPNNEKHKNEMELSFFDNLQKCHRDSNKDENEDNPFAQFGFERSKVLCSVGIAIRILSTLEIYDFDESIKNSLSYDMVMDDVIRRVHTEIIRLVELNASNVNNKHYNYAIAFDDPNNDCTEDEKIEFNKEIMEYANTIIQEYSLPVLSKSSILQYIECGLHAISN